MALNDPELAELVKHSTEALTIARDAAEKVLATSTGTQREQAQAALSLLNQALDLKVDDLHDDEA